MIGSGTEQTTGIGRAPQKDRATSTVWYSPREIPQDVKIKAIHDKTYVRRDTLPNGSMTGIPLEIPSNLPIGSIITVISYAETGDQVVHYFRTLKDDYQGQGVCVIRTTSDKLLPAVSNLVKDELGFELPKREQQAVAGRATLLTRNIGTIPGADVTNNTGPTHFQRIETQKPDIFTVGVLTPQSLASYRTATQQAATKSMSSI